MENKKIIETDSFVSSYWEINISFSGKLNKDNYILISRNNYYCRMFELKIYDDKIDLFDLFDLINCFENFPNASGSSNT